jgi:excisionase family DNA binding protein
MSEQTDIERVPIPRVRLHATSKPGPSAMLRERLLQGLCSTDELSKALKVHWRTIYQYCEQGMSFCKFGGKRYFDIDEVHAWIRSHQHNSLPRSVGRPRKKTNGQK